MDGRFDPALKSIYVTGTLHGPAGLVDVTLALDTGATRTVISAPVLRLAGYDLRRPAGQATLTAATGRARAPLISIDALAALGHARPLLVAAHDLPATYRGHGLLGRDFFAGLVLTIDFARSTVSLRRPGRRWWPFAG
jgi:predicted aspartyl protease